MNDDAFRDLYKCTLNFYFKLNFIIDVLTKYKQDTFMLLMKSQTFY